MKQMFIVLILVGLSYAQRCPEGQVWCNGTDPIECIPEEYVCDFVYIDCSNDWDEQDCPCRDDEWTCANGECIYQSEIDCDGYKQCSDGSDEMNCETCRAIAPLYQLQEMNVSVASDFMCNDGRCLTEYQICDGRDDCPNGEEEEPGCPKCDPRYLWTCADLSCCFKSDVCDGNPDCPDGSDEWDCTMTGTDVSASNTGGVKRQEKMLTQRKSHNQLWLGGLSIPERSKSVDQNIAKP